MDGLCRNWSHVTSQHSQEDEGSLKGVHGVGKSMLDQGSGGLELPWRREGAQNERCVVIGGVGPKSRQDQKKDGVL